MTRGQRAWILLVAPALWLAIPPSAARAQGAEPVQASAAELKRMGLRYVTGDLLRHNHVVRHHQERLTRLLLEEFVKRQTRK